MYYLKWVLVSSIGVCLRNCVIFTWKVYLREWEWWILMELSRSRTVSDASLVTKWITLILSFCDRNTIKCWFSHPSLFWYYVQHNIQTSYFNHQFVYFYQKNSQNFVKEMNLTNALCHRVCFWWYFCSQWNQVYIYVLTGINWNVLTILYRTVWDQFFM